jgi:hydrogenase nickel incorporation protein HypB
MKVIEPEEGEVIFDIELDENLQKENLRIAEENKKILREKGIKAVDVMGSVGAGKTSLIERMVERLDVKVAVINGDLTTTIDADRLKTKGVETVQINTGKECHLDANLVRKALSSLDLDSIDLILIENVGNLICPAEFPLGAELRIVVVSAAESPWAVSKHPYIFLDADMVAINKVDVAKLVGSDPTKMKEDVLSFNPSAEVFLTNCVTGEGVDELVNSLKSKLGL